MLQKIRVRRFKTVVDVTIELGKLNVFIGANGVGKTNLFEAIALLGAAASGKVDEVVLRDRGVRRSGTGRSPRSRHGPTSRATGRYSGTLRAPGGGSSSGSG